MHSNNAIYVQSRDGTAKRLEIASKPVLRNDTTSHLASVPPGYYAAWAGANLSIFILASRVRKRKS